MPTLSVIEAKFKRANLKSLNTFLYSMLEESTKKQIDEDFKNVCKEEEEDYVIYYSDRLMKYSWIMSTNRIIVLDKEKLSIYRYTAIKQVKIEGLINRDKHNINSIGLTFSDDSHLDIRVEESTWHFIYMLLKFLAP